MSRHAGPRSAKQCILSYIQRLLYLSFETDHFVDFRKQHNVPKSLKYLKYFGEVENRLTLKRGPGYDVKLIRCCPQYDVKLMWRHRGNDIVSVAAICATTQLIFLFGRTRLAV